MDTEKRTPWKTFLRDVIITGRKALESAGFIHEHRLWEKMNSYKWLAKGIIIIIALVSYYSISTFWGNYKSIVDNDPSTLHAATGALTNTFSGMSDMFLNGSFKYIALILIEVVIFHFVRRTLIIITGNQFDTSFNSFVKAQVRMIQVSFYAYIMEMVYGLLVKVAVGIFPIEIFESVILFLISAFFIGYAIVDNYNEVYHMTIKQSSNYTYQYAGVTLTVGTIVYVIISIPYIGYVIGPLIGAVIAALSMHTVTMRDDDMAWVFIKKEKKKKTIVTE